MRIFSLGMAVMMLGLGGVCVAQEAEPVPGAVDMAEALQQRQAYVCENADQEMLDTLRRDLR